MALSDDVKARVSLREMCDTVTTLDRGKSKPARGEFFYACPLHGESTASFHVTEKPGQVGGFYCYGCHAHGSVIDLVMGLDGVGFPEAVNRLAAEHGIGRAAPDPAAQDARAATVKARQDAAAVAEARDTARAIAAAAAIWSAAFNPKGRPDPILADYLSARIGQRIDPPASLRLAPDLVAWGTDDHGRPRSIHRGPAMVAICGRRGSVPFAGVHRTWITPTGRARLLCGAKVPKQMKGPTFGAPVPLTPSDPRSTLIVGEGIESTLAALVTLRAALEAGRPIPPRVPVQPASPLTAEAALSLGALAGAEGAPRDPADLCPRTGHPLPSVVPAPDRPGWLPPLDHEGPVLVCADPSARSPLSAERHALRALAKLTDRGFFAVVVTPADTWDTDDDFADLAQRGVLEW